jgi:predicted DNA-binding transcriptional regulator AlpA
VQMQTAAAVPAAAVPSSNPWLTVREYAAREGIDRATVWRWIAKGVLEVKRKAPRIGVKVRERRT